MNTLEEFAKEAGFESSDNGQDCKGCGNFVPQRYHCNGPTVGICKKMMAFGIGGVSITVFCGDVVINDEGISRFLRDYDKMSQDEINSFLDSYDWETKKNSRRMMRMSCRFRE